jgi:hypothetical protein
VARLERRYFPDTGQAGKVDDLTRANPDARMYQ